MGAVSAKTKRRARRVRARAAAAVGARRRYCSPRLRYIVVSAVSGVRHRRRRRGLRTAGPGMHATALTVVEVPHRLVVLVLEPPGAHARAVVVRGRLAAELVVQVEQRFLRHCAYAYMRSAQPGPDLQRS